MNGDELRRAREELGMTQEQAATAIGAELDTYRSWEYGKRRPRAKMAAHIRAVMTGGEIPADPVRRIAELELQVRLLARAVDDLTAVVRSIRIPLRDEEAK